MGRYWCIFLRRDAVVKPDNHHSDKACIFRIHCKAVQEASMMTNMYQELFRWYIFFI